MSQNYELSTNEILTEALHRFGIKNQTDLAIEEMSELIEYMLSWGANNGVIFHDNMQD